MAGLGGRWPWGDGGLLVGHSDSGMDDDAKRKSQVKPLPSRIGGDCVIAAGDCVFGFLLSSFLFYFFFFLFNLIFPGRNVTFVPFTPLAAFADADRLVVYPTL